MRFGSDYGLKDLSILVIKEREYKSLYDWCQLVESSGETRGETRV
jgi:hypothetical protein